MKSGEAKCKGGFGRGDKYFFCDDLSRSNPVTVMNEMAGYFALPHKDDGARVCCVDLSCIAVTSRDAVQ